MHSVTSNAVAGAISTEVSNRNNAITNAINTEVTNRNNAINNACGYTWAEHFTGTYWADGKPIYRICFEQWADVNSTTITLLTLQNGYFDKVINLHNNIYTLPKAETSQVPFIAQLDTFYAVDYAFPACRQRTVMRLYNNVWYLQLICENIDMRCRSIGYIDFTKP